MNRSSGFRLMPLNFRVKNTDKKDMGYQKLDETVIPNPWGEN